MVILLISSNRVRHAPYHRDPTPDISPAQVPHEVPRPRDHGPYGPTRNLATLMATRS